MTQLVQESRIKLFGATIQVQEKQDHNHHDHNNGEEKKPDKIIPCPRCKSMETKFCYFNNYNVNQPRHFCKSCQRYWTAGGALRNVPIGAGRRKAKPLYDAARDMVGLSETCFFDQLDFDGRPVPEEWNSNGDFPHLFPAKRRRSTSGSQSY